MALTILGIDLSLVSSGLASITIDDEGAPDARIETTTVGEKGKQDAPHEVTLARIERQAGRVVGWAKEQRDRMPGEPITAAIEGPSLGSTNGLVHVRAGLWWMTAHYLRKAGIDVSIVPPAKLKQYATGKGGGELAKKEHVMAAVARAYPHSFAEDDNQADAIVLAGMLARELGHPLEVSVQRVHPFALANVAWSDLVRAYRAART